MSILNLLATPVPAAVKREGQKIFDDRIVVIEEVEPGVILAEILLEGDPCVSVQLVGSSLLVACDCEDFVDSLKPCSHIWAALLEIDASNCWHVNSRQPLKIKPDEATLEEWDIEEPEDWDDDDEDDDDEDYDEAPPPQSAFPRPITGGMFGTPPGSSGQPRPAGWKSHFQTVREVEQRKGEGSTSWTRGRQIVYVLDLNDRRPAVTGQFLPLLVGYRNPLKDGSMSRPYFQALSSKDVQRFGDSLDQEVIGLLRGARVSYFGSYGSYGSHGSYGVSTSTHESLPIRYELRPPVRKLLEQLCETERLFYLLDGSPDLIGPLFWQEPAWQFCLELREEKKNYLLSGYLQRDTERAALTEPVFCSQHGVLIWPDHVTAVDFGEGEPWLSVLLQHKQITIPEKEGPQVVEELLSLPVIPRVSLPEELHFETVQVEPRPRLIVTPPSPREYNNRLHGALSFEYDGTIVEAKEPHRGTFDAEHNRWLPRDSSAEDRFAARLLDLGFRFESGGWGVPPSLRLPPSRLPTVVSTLLAENWYVEAEGKILRTGGSFNIQVESGIDWFELHGQAEFEGETVPLPELLKAIRKGEKSVRLGDGSYGVLPEEWLKKYGLLAGLGKVEEGHIRFAPSQVGLLDALLATQPRVEIDAKFARARDELKGFAGVEPLEPTGQFVGELRPYQQDGLGWLQFLRKFGLGGCLADDMGLGKTIQVLAMLESRRQQTKHLPKKKRMPSLIVVPRSLIFNWKQEASRFTPKLRVLDYSGVDRPRDPDAFADQEVVLTTYGTLRRDVLLLKQVEFDYCILDEAQAIKNSSSQAAKSARLIQATHRLALSGTPVENHLGELWSIFEFLNPGMLGSASLFKRLTTGKHTDEEGRRLLGQALRPFILRRTKEEVVKELPAKTEQTIYCDLKGKQRKEYDELREYYRQSLLAKVEAEGMNKAKIHVLEGLLRLRQAACHPGLINTNKDKEPSAKLDILMGQLEEILSEGHKVLVFSQFTTFLKIVRNRLEQQKIAYAYLDGQTRNRQERVEEFQNDKDCKLFLISLKAGGLGLNLTAAEYVILLDPWWNPAVESQAIDRAHRIGQEHPVFAYRIIARDTVEEKVLQLQQTKRELADAILNADNALVRNLTQEDLLLLLS